MRLDSARVAWHDAYYTPRDSISALAIEWARLGGAIQLSNYDRRTLRAAHQALAGAVQKSIGRLPPHIRAYGHWLYNPLADDDTREAAEALVFYRAFAKSPRMTAWKAERARYVAAGVLHRYRRMNQGGQGAQPDPLRAPEAFRQWLLDLYGVPLPSAAWARDWGVFVRLCFDVCDDLDRQALAPVSALLRTMKAEADALGCASVRSR